MQEFPYSARKSEWAKQTPCRHCLYRAPGHETERDGIWHGKNGVLSGRLSSDVIGNVENALAEAAVVRTFSVNLAGERAALLVRKCNNYKS